MVLADCLQFYHMNFRYETFAFKKNRLMRGLFDYTAQLTLGLVCSIHVVEELPEFYRAVGRSESLWELSRNCCAKFATGLNMYHN